MPTSARPRTRPTRSARSDGEVLDASALVELRAALTAGASPAAALAAAAAPTLPSLARALRLGTPLGRVAAELATGDPRADLLVRALAVAEHAGAGAVDAVDQVRGATREERALARLLAARTAQARGTAVVLTALPAGVVALLTLLGGAPLAYYATPWGWATGALALVLGAAGLVAARALVARAAAAPARVDPLVVATQPAPRRRRVVIALTLAALAGLLGGLGVALVVGGIAAPLVARGGTAPAAPEGSPRARAAQAGGTAETVELVGVALRAGLPPLAALATAAEVAPPLARPHLAAAARRLRTGRPVGEVLADTPLAPLGAVLAVGERWGAPSGQPLADLADELRADRRAAAEHAAERAQLLLIFPTTLLTLPAFTLALLPPMLWRALEGLGGILA